MRIGIDLMGGDSSPETLFTAVVQAAEKLQNSCSLVVIASPNIIEKLAQPSFHYPGRIEWSPASDVIEMEDHPLHAARKKKNSSMLVGLRLLKKKQINAFISPGNTGALIAAASLNLPKYPGFKRPALLTVLPTTQNHVAILDVGGNVSCKSNHLVQFAYLGAAYQATIQGIKKPRIGLLNVGTESKKGRSEVQQAYEILNQQKNPHFEFIGNIEGRNVFQGKVDVLVTDGFTGNVLLKTAEGLVEFFSDYFKQTIEDQNSKDLKMAFEKMEQHFQYSEYPGAILCGVDAIVIKCHGDTSSQALCKAILGTFSLAKNKINEKMKFFLVNV